jgi:hypothetical protein
MAKHRFNTPGLPYVFMDEDGYLQMYSHKGDRIICNQFLRLQDSISEPPTVIGKFRCNIVGSKQEMEQEIKEGKNLSPFQRDEESDKINTVSRPCTNTTIKL